MDDALTFGWYGKSPSAGDFVSRRLARPVVHALDRWFQAGMTALRDRAPERWERDYGSAPVWNALLPSRILAPEPCLLAVAASCDRVGRRFPFSVVATLKTNALSRVTSLADCSNGVSRLVQQSIRASIAADEFDRQLRALAARFLRDADEPAGDASDIGAVLDDLEIESDELATVPLNASSAFPWPDLARTFDAAATTSYWWASAQPGRQASAGFTHSGALDPALFVMLFGDSAAQAPSSGAADEAAC